MEKFTNDSTTDTREHEQREKMRVIGRLGGLKKSEKKTAAVRENGKKGGRPKKNTMKNFENYKKIDEFNGVEVWSKEYSDGQKAQVLIDDKKITRKIVKKAFNMQENGEHRNCYRYHGAYKNMT